MFMNRINNVKTVLHQHDETIVAPLHRVICRVNRTGWLTRDHALTMTWQPSHFPTICQDLNRAVVVLNLQSFDICLLKPWKNFVCDIDNDSWRFRQLLESVSDLCHTLRHTILDLLTLL